MTDLMRDLLLGKRLRNITLFRRGTPKAPVVAYDAVYVMRGVATQSVVGQELVAFLKANHAPDKVTRLVEGLAGRNG